MVIDVEIQDLSLSGTKAIGQGFKPRRTIGRRQPRLLQSKTDRKLRQAILQKNKGAILLLYWRGGMDLLQRTRVGTQLLTGFLGDSTSFFTPITSAWNTPLPPPNCKMFSGWTQRSYKVPGLGLGQPLGAGCVLGWMPCRVSVLPSHPFWSPFPRALDEANERTLVPGHNQLVAENGPGTDTQSGAVVKQRNHPQDRLHDVAGANEDLRAIPSKVGLS